VHVSIRAVLFDIYGTLLRSDAGEIHPDPALRAEIAGAHAASPHPFPEVDIREIHAMLHPGRSSEEIERLALEAEQRSNPVTAMEGAAETLESLKERGLALGLISNAQFYTAPVLEACIGRSLLDAGISPALCCFSYLERRAKPDAYLFEAARERLAQNGIEANQVLYVGNDVRNDIEPARACGFLTALFAGDESSLRLRGRSLDDSGADHVIYDLREILKLV
jgi:putative hydrolase of the HAD superfamily